MTFWWRHNSKPKQGENTMPYLVLPPESRVMQVSTKATLPNHLIMSSSSKAWKLDSSVSGTNLAVVHETSTFPLDVIFAEHLHENRNSEGHKPGDCTIESKAKKQNNKMFNKWHSRLTTDWNDMWVMHVKRERWTGRRTQQGFLQKLS